MSRSSKNTSNPKRNKRRKTPKHAVVTRSYSFPIDVSSRQEEKIREHVFACWRLRNHFVKARAENRAVNRLRKQKGEKTDYLTRADQYADIRQFIRHDVGLLKVHSQVLQNVAVRVDEGYKRFFEGLKDGRNVSPPKYIDLKRYRSLTYPQYGTSAHIKNGILHLSKLGDFKVHSYRKIKGKAKTVTLKFKQGRWWAIVTAEAQEKDVIQMIQDDDMRMDVGVDPGLTSLLFDSEGNAYDPPKASLKYRKKLRHAQRTMSRQFEARKKAHAEMTARLKEEGAKEVAPLSNMPYSNRLKKQIVAVARIHTKIERCRDHYHKKNAAVIESRFRRVAVEEHPVTFMLKDRKLAKAAADRAIHGRCVERSSACGQHHTQSPAERRKRAEPGLLAVPGDATDFSRWRMSQFPLFEIFKMITHYR